MPRLAAALLLCLSFLLPLPPVAAAEPGYEQRVLEIVNQERSTAGLAPLAHSAPLAASARDYAALMIQLGFFGHQCPRGSTFVQRNEAAGYSGWVFLGENLAGGQPDPRSAVAAWMNSPGHRANILSPDARELGIGYVFNPKSTYGHYWVQEFGARNGTPPRAAGIVQTAKVGEAVQGASAVPTPAPVPAAPPTELRTDLDSLDTLGVPLSGVVLDPATGRWIQFYQRAVLEWHPENDPSFRVQRRLLGDVLFPGFDPPVAPSDAPPGPHSYFPLSSDRPTGLGHFVADYTRTGQAIHFKRFFDDHGGARALGYPKEEPRLRDGYWTQRFQAGTLRYHPEFDRDGFVPGTSTPLRNYRVQLDLLGETAYAAHKTR